MSIFYNGRTVEEDIIAYDTMRNNYYFFSYLINSANLKKSELKTFGNISVNGMQLSKHSQTKYSVESAKLPNSPYTLVTAFANDWEGTYTHGDKKYISISSVIYLDREKGEDIYDKVQEKLDKYMPMPILKEWIPSITGHLFATDSLRELRVINAISSSFKEMYLLTVNEKVILDFIVESLKKGDFKINGSNKPSEMSQFIEGLDSYLNLFGDALAGKIQERFAPKFVPGVDEYSEWVNKFDDYAHYNGIDIYDAQKAAIQAAVNNFKDSNVTLVISEMGTGNLVCIA